MSASNSLPLDAHGHRVQCLMWAATGPKTLREPLKVDLVDLVDDRHHSLLNNFVFQRRDAQRTLSPLAFGI